MASVEKGYKSHTGKVRSNNQDFASSFSTPSGELYVVCDGMGGHTGGEIASSLAVQEIGRVVLGAPPNSNILQLLGKAIDAANFAIYQKATADHMLQGMGTTGVILLLSDDCYYLAHVGDSRIYSISGGQISQITKDQSFVQILVDEGHISPAAAKDHPRKNEITHFIGEGPNMEHVVQGPFRLVGDERFLLCSDGLSDLVDADEIQRLGLLGHVQSTCDALVELALERGGYDNITVMMVKVGTPNASFRQTTNIVTPVVSSGAVTQQKRGKSFLYGTISVVAGLLVLLGILVYSFFPSEPTPVPVPVASKSQRGVGFPKVEPFKTAIEAKKKFDYYMDEAKCATDASQKFKTDFSKINDNLRQHVDAVIKRARSYSTAANAAAVAADKIHEKVFLKSGEQETSVNVDKPLQNNFGNSLKGKVVNWLDKLVNNLTIKHENNDTQDLNDAYMLASRQAEQSKDDYGTAVTDLVTKCKENAEKAQGTSEAKRDEANQAAQTAANATKAATEAATAEKEAGNAALTASKVIEIVPDFKGVKEAAGKAKEAAGKAKEAAGKAKEAARKAVSLAAKKEEDTRQQPRAPRGDSAVQQQIEKIVLDVKKTAEATEEIAKKVSAAKTDCVAATDEYEKAKRAASLARKEPNKASAQLDIAKKADEAATKFLEKARKKESAASLTAPSLSSGSVTPEAPHQEIGK